jgi:nucleotidyltransferase substrate binding protein (TIGR01987 family)
MERKSINRYRSFCSSLYNLADARERTPDDKFVLSGTVQMYNLSFDLSWKVMKDIIIEFHGILEYATGSPRETLRMARSVGLISDDIWMEMLKARNNLAHDYDGILAVHYFQNITTEYYKKLDEFRQKAEKYFEDQI